jgi:oligopeptide/dipeptide ABC transporter ATP-binding protein
MAELLLQAQGVSRSFPAGGGATVKAVQDVTLSVEAGETVGLVGESGCGKSTLGRVLLGLDRADSGTITFAGRPLGSGSPKALRREVQIVFQDPYSALNPRISVGSAIGEVLRVHGICGRAATKAHVSELLERVGLRPDLADRKPFELSGGERQRVVIARAIATGPRLIVADEAVSALDVSIQAQILNLFARLQDELDLAYLFISHDLGVVRHVSQRMFVMYLGRIVESGSTKTVFAHPRHPYTQGLLAAVPSLDPAARNASRPLSGDVPNAIDPPSGCAFHPRCPLATDVCRERTPERRTAADGVEVACHHADLTAACSEPAPSGGS